LSNAIKYRRPDAVLEIGVSSKLVNNVVIIEFADNGLGIDLSNNKHKIFKPYNRFHTEIEGKGIGLYLVQSQVQMLGGKISVSSKVGVGTTFIIELKK
jgi:signal transduction histidine kinase